MAVKKNDSHQIFIGIRKIRTKGRFSEYPKAINSINSNLKEHFNFVPSEIRSINHVLVVSKEGFHNELVWQSNVIQSKSNILNEFIRLKRTYSNYVLQGKINLASDILQKIEENCGWSIWLIEAKFFCLQQTKGLEGNKEFLQEIYSQRNISNEFDLVYYLAFLISERNESGCHIGDFHQRVNKLFENIEDQRFKEHLLCVVSYVVFNDIKKEINPSEYLSNIKTLPAIDVYELILRILVEHKDSLDTNQIKLPLRILSSIEDTRLSRINFLYGFSQEKHFDSITDNNSATLLTPQIYNHKLMLGHQFDVSGDYIEKFHSSNISIINQDDNFDEAFLFLAQFSVNFKHIDEIYELLRIARMFLGVSEVEVVKCLATIYGVVIDEITLSEHLIDNGLEADLKTKLEAIKKADSFNSILDITVKEDESSNEVFSPYIFNLTKFFTFYSLMNKGDYSKAFRLYVNMYIENNNISRAVELEPYLKNKGWSFFKKLDSYVDAAIILDVYNKYMYDDKQLFNLKSCWRSFIKESNVTKPSELNTSHFNENYNKYSHFLSNICTPEVIGSDANVYKNERDIKIERISICNKLLEHELNISIIEERDSLERNIAILDGLNEVEIAGLTVDQERFKSIAKNKYSNDFNRYKSFVELMLNKGMNQEGDDKSPPEHSLITKPIDEGDRILINLIHSLGDMFLKNQEFGLDYYLSMRIRHGRLIGISRGPLERRRLVTKYSDIEGKYLDNEYWFNHYQELLDFESLVELNTLLSKFSQDFDNLVKEFKENQVQIKSDDKPDGFFSIKISHGGLDVLKTSINEGTTIDDFLNVITEYFLILIEKSSQEVKLWLESTFKNEINDCLLNLQTGVENLIKRNKKKSNPISSEIASARTELNQTIDDISSWFDISTEDKTSIRVYTMENVIEISLARTSRIYQDFLPKVKSDIRINDITFHSSALALLVDALTIIFSNIFVHGRNSTPTINIKSKYISTEDSKVKVNIHISNSVESTKINFERLKKIHEELASNQLKSRQEGGSGFHKLAAMPLISNAKDINFGYDDHNGEFFVDLTFSLDLI